jgi:DNA-binding protein HU-beta
MNKKEMVAKVAENMGVTKKEAALSVETVFDIITESLNSGEKVSMVGFGSFEVVKRNERKCRNLQTGEEMVVPAKMAPKFRPSKGLKTTVATLPV